MCPGCGTGTAESARGTLPCVPRQTKFTGELHGIFVDADGAVFISDTEPQRVCVLRRQ
jgi:hypothetical protein